MPDRRANSGRQPRLGWLDGALLLLALAMSLVAASADYAAIEEALGLMKTQTNLEQYDARMAVRQLGDPDSSWLVRQHFWLSKVLEQAAALLVVGTIGSAVALFARPRSWRRRSIRGAGVIAVLGLVPWLAIGTISQFLLRRLHKSPWGYEGTFHIWTEIAEPIGGAVGAVWLLLWVGRSWRAEAGWRDRLGRSLACAWVVYGVVEAFVLPWTEA